MWVKTKDRGRLINTRHIAQLRSTKQGVYAVMESGDDHLLHEDFWDLETRLELDAVVPAQPGFEALYFNCETDADAASGFVSREPVLAWRVHENTASAVTLEPHMAPNIIKRPDGSVSNVWEADWETEEKWLESARDSHNEIRERRATIAAKKAG